VVDAEPGRVGRPLLHAPDHTSALEKGALCGPGRRSRSEWMAESVDDTDGLPRLLVRHRRPKAVDDGIVAAPATPPDDRVGQERCKHDVQNQGGGGTPAGRTRHALDGLHQMAWAPPTEAV